MGDTVPDGAWRKHLYLQTRLKERNGRTRLLTIQPRQYAASRPESPPDTIHCFLRLAELKERPQFTVVSHRWDAADPTDETRSVLVNGAAVPVSAGLFEVLHHLQKAAEPAVVWIDALCVNYADEGARERSAQVAQLAQIYAAAEKTLVWLGGAADGSDAAMRVLRRLSEEQLTVSAYVASWAPQIAHQLVQKMLPARLAGHHGGGGPAAPRGEGKEPLELQKELESLRAPLQALMERAYWADLWSLAELCMTQRGVVVCGGHGLALDHFYSAARALDHIINHLTYLKWLAAATGPANTTTANTTTTTTTTTGAVLISSEEVSNLSRSPALRVLGRRDEHRSGDAYAWLRAPDHPLLTLLTRYFAPSAPSTPAAAAGGEQLPLRVRDPRDRVFALACLATDAAELGIAADYGGDADRVYADASAALLRRHPGVLQLARGTAGTGDGEKEGDGEGEGRGGGEEERLPSWAVDWGNVRAPPPSPAPSSDRCFNACGPADARYYRANVSGALSGRIALRAGVVGAVYEVGAPYRPAAAAHNDEDDDENDDEDARSRQRAYLAEIRRFWEDSTASIGSPYFAAQAAVALAKIPVGDVEDGSTAGGTAAVGPALTRASSATVEGYKRTVEALFPSSPPSETAAAAADDDDKPVKEREGEEKEEKEEEGEEGEGREGKESLSAPDTAYVRAMARMAGRRPFRSSNGYVGLGPADLAAGDAVAIPYGSAVPFAFRRVRREGEGGGEREGDGAVYRLVGEVYVFGIMDGEFMKVHRQETMLKIV
ncbi:heterokaryon incompatibility protein-domain-containing protein [Xylaria palmicola]|nr:heterokaryon incompatibility protein-domain-containing protein [Xylaria palmicola]